MPSVLVLDFDSTFVSGETLEVMAELVFDGDPDGEAKVARIEAVTDAAMNGEIEFGDALAARLDILRPTGAQVAATAEALAGMLTPSFARNREVIRRHAGHIFIVSGGFHETIDAIAADFGLRPDHVLANRLRFDGEGRATSVDESCPLARSGGKAEMVRALGLGGDVAVVGDGWTDYEIRQTGAAERFYAFTEVVARDRVVAAADSVAATFDEVLIAEGMS